MTKGLLLLLSVAALVGCDRGNDVDEKNASVGDVAKAVTKAGPTLRFMPGRWESKVEFVGIEAPDMPPELVGAIQGATGRNRVFDSCLTKEEAERPDGDFFNRDAKDCKYEHFTMGAGKIDAKMVCSKSADGQAIVEMKGDYSPTHYSMAMATRAESGSQGAMTMKMKVESKHVGACTGDETAG